MRPGQSPDPATKQLAMAARRIEPDHRWLPGVGKGRLQRELLALAAIDRRAGNGPRRWLLRQTDGRLC